MIIGSLIKAAVKTAVLPIAVIKDVVDSTDEPFEATSSTVESIGSDINDVIDDIFD